MSTLRQLIPGAVNVPTATTATLTLTLPSTVLAGNNVEVSFSFAGNGAGTPTLNSITDDLGNTYAIAKSTTRPGTTGPCLNYVLVAAANTPQTISIVVGVGTSQSLYVAGVAYEVSGAGALDAPGAAATGTTSGSTAVAASLTTAGTNEIAFAVLSSNNGAETYTQNNGWTQDFHDVNTNSYFFHSTLSSSGANSLNMTASASVFTLWNAVAFLGGATLAASGGGGASGTASLTTTPRAAKTGYARVVMSCFAMNADGTYNPRYPSGNKVTITTTEAQLNATPPTPGVFWTFTFAAIGGSTPYVWSNPGGPAWATMNPSTGVLSGTPTGTETDLIEIVVVDA
ncbi:MAG TPA: hypothetical protein VGM99_02925, partial [Candidatus Cybelea sp.]